MEKQRNIKILSIVALVLAIAGMSLGFAAFSATLNISSSASVTPNSDNFNIIFCNSINIGDCNSDGNFFLDYETVNGATNGGTMADVMGTFASDLGASFTTTNQSIIYKFYVHNVGEYDAYLRGISFTALDSGTYKKCSATTTDDTQATDSLVQAACEGIDVTISIGGTQYDLGSNISGHKLSKGRVEEVQVKIEYKSGSALADGPFKVEISDFKLDYSTVDSVNLISFTIDGVTYQAEEGMTWLEWVDSSYNIDYYYADYGGGICSSNYEKVIYDETTVIEKGKDYSITIQQPCTT